MRAIGFTAGLVLLLTATTCFPRLDVDVRAGTEPGRPMIEGKVKREVIGGLSELKVTSCGPSYLEETTWKIERDDSLAGPVVVTYGRVPPGFRETVPAAPLRPGRCYLAAAAWSGGMVMPGAREFDVLEDGGIRERSAGVFSGSWTRELERGAVGCVRGYRRARTPADSSAVDARAFPLADTTLTCGYLRENTPTELAESMSSERRVLLLALYLSVLVGASVLMDQIPEPK